MDWMLDGLDAHGLVTLHYPLIFILKDVMDGWMDGCRRDGWMGWMLMALSPSTILSSSYCQMSWMDGWMDGWMSEGWMDGLDAHGLVTFHHPLIFILSDVMDGWMDGCWRDGWMGWMVMALSPSTILSSSHCQM